MPQHDHVTTLLHHAHERLHIDALCGRAERQQIGNESSEPDSAVLHVLLRLYARLSGVQSIIAVTVPKRKPAGPKRSTTVHKFDLPEIRSCRIPRRAKYTATSRRC